jgi:hypothetical protein
MEQEAADRFFDQLANSPELRAEFRDDPAGTLVRAGGQLDEQGRRELAEIDWSQLPDQELAQRVSKSKKFFTH